MVRSKKNRRQRKRLTTTEKENIVPMFKRDQHGAHSRPLPLSPGRGIYAPERSATESSNYTDTFGESIRFSKPNSIVATKISEAENHFHTDSKFFFGCPGPRDSRFDKLIVSKGLGYSREPNGIGH